MGEELLLCDTCPGDKCPPPDEGGRSWLGVCESRGGDMGSLFILIPLFKVLTFKAAICPADDVTILPKKKKHKLTLAHIVYSKLVAKIEKKIV